MTKPQVETSLRKAREDRGLSLREAARLLGVTHAYLSGLELGHKRLTSDRADQIARLYGLAPQHLKQPLPEDKEVFLGWLRNQIKWWDSRFVLPKIPAVVRLISDLFVTPTFQEADQDPVSQEELLKGFFGDSGEHALLLTGAIGTGKSFFLRMLALDTDAVLTRLKIERRFVPILVSLGEYQIIPGSLTKSLVEYYLQHGFAGSGLQLERFFQQCLERGQALLLFDGLDEIHNHQQRAQVFARLRQHYEDEIRRQGNRMIISGREDAFFERDRRNRDYRLTKILPWQTSQMFEGCMKWSWEESAQAERFWHVVQANEAVFALARWPLLFHLLTTLSSSSGLKPFQELAGLCDACCEVLENSWDAARRVLSKRGSSRPEGDPLDLHPWLKWRHFLVHAMSRVLDGVVQGDEPLKLSFSPSELKEAWEDYLMSKGIERRSLDFARLEDLLSNQHRIGPVFYQRTIEEEEGETRIAERFCFPDRIFGFFYLARALLGNPERLKQILSRKLRDPDWSEIIALTVQELGRSDRAFENSLGEELLELILALDDGFGLEKNHQIGHYGLFTAARAIASSNLDRHWSKIIEPYLKAYMTSPYESASSLTFGILGEYCVSAKLMKHFAEQYRGIFEEEHEERFSYWDDKWRLLAALAIFGKRTDSIVDELINDISLLGKKGKKATSEDRVGTRRTLSCLRQIGRLYVLEEGAQRALKRENIEKITGAINDLIDFTLDSFEDELKKSKYSDVHYWDLLTIALQSEERLKYDELLGRTINKAAKIMNRHLDMIVDGYPHYPQLIQFLKCALVHANRLEENVAGLLAMGLRAQLERIQGADRREIEVLVTLISRKEQLRSERFPHRLYFEEVYGRCDLEHAEGALAVIDEEASSAVQIGNALRTIYFFAQSGATEERQKFCCSASDKILSLLARELALPAVEREHERLYTVSFTNYGYPLYDHIYNCLVEVGRYLPLEKS